MAMGVPGEKDVLRLDIPVNHPGGMRRAERVGDLTGDIERVRHRQLLLSLKPAAEGFALDVRHDVVEQAGSLPGVVQRQDVGMVETSGDADLTEESLGAESGRHVSREDFDGDLAAVLLVGGEVDRTHPATAKLALDRVTAPQGDREACDRIGQGGPSL